MDNHSLCRVKAQGRGQGFSKIFNLFFQFCDVAEEAIR
jgi:hypothetical protein